MTYDRAESKIGIPKNPKNNIKGKELPHWNDYLKYLNSFKKEKKEFDDNYMNIKDDKVLVNIMEKYKLSPSDVRLISLNNDMKNQAKFKIKRYEARNKELEIQRQYEELQKQKRMTPKSEGELDSKWLILIGFALMILIFYLWKNS